MLEIRKTAIALEEEELLELERIVIDRDEKDALVFLKKSVYDKVARSQQGRLKSHLDTIVQSLGKLNEKAIPRMRGKEICKALLSRGETLC